MKTYTKPEIEVKQFANGDIITTLSNNQAEPQKLNTANAIKWGDLQ